MISLRLLQEKDWQDLKAIRLEGLKTYPNMLGQPYAEAATMTEAQWIAWLDDPNRGYFGIYDGDTIIGFHFVRIFDDAPLEARMNGLYIKRAYQRRGIDRLIFETSLAWAKAQNCRSMSASCKDTNYSSKRLIEKYGGVFIKKSDEPGVFPDGSTGYGLFYTLDLT